MNKIFIIILFFAISLSWAKAGDFSSYGDKMERFQKHPSEEGLNEIIDILFTRRWQTRENYKSDKYYLRAQKMIICSPVFQQWIHDNTTYMRSEQINHPEKERGTAMDYSSRRTRFMQTLAQLPSPDSVGALGGFLNDDRYVRIIPHGDDVIVPHSENSSHAAYGLAIMGINDYPVKETDAERAFYKTSPIRDTSTLMSARLWWEEVKSGRKTFSFKGQSVEYRFKPDGTWDTIPMKNLPDDGPKPVAGGAESREVREKPSVSPRTPVPQLVTRTPWRWLAAGFALVLAALGFLLWKGRRKPTG